MARPDKLWGCDSDCTNREVCEREGRSLGCEKCSIPEDYLRSPEHHLQRAEFTLSKQVEYAQGVIPYRPILCSMNESQKREFMQTLLNNRVEYLKSKNMFCDIPGIDEVKCQFVSLNLSPWSL